MAFLKIYEPTENDELLKINLSEVKRYAGIMSRSALSETDNDMERLINECIKEVLPVLTYKVSYMRFPVARNENRPGLPFNDFGSKNLAKNLTGCHEVVLFAATVGIGIDRLIAKYNKVSPVKALFMQALGAERIESLCDFFNREIREEAEKSGCVTAPRYSPGYGDLPIEVQKEFMTILDCSRRLGINLNESLLMSPSKSVTAIIGIKKNTGDCEEQHGSGRDSCNKTDCEFKK